MRTALQCSARLSVVLSTRRLLPSTWKRATSKCIPKDVLASKHHYRFASSLHDQKQSEIPPNLAKLLKTKDFDVDPKDPSSLVTLYDEFLPKHLRIEKTNAPEHSGEFSRRKLWKLAEIRDCARTAADVDLWQWMVYNGYRKQLVWLINKVLRDIASRQAKAKLQEIGSSSSNIQWPADIFQDLHYADSAENALTDFDFSRGRTPDLSKETSRHFVSSRTDRAFMAAVWSFLAKLVITANESQPAQSRSCMNVVLLILANIHNLDMVHADIYSYKLLNSSSTIARPPILHLVYSRILASLSDATWREQQDDAIAQASQLGHDSKYISENVPGGRFRLKVQELPLEIWLELILWCCVDGGYSGVASEIISMIHHAENPWFAVRWCATQTSPVAETLVDWNRVKLRHGGTVGLIEGYSHDKPFADVPKNTISVEVVLALIESCVNGTGASSSFEDISNLLQFLEPHDLPPSYFDYLESRLIHAGLFDNIDDPNRAQECVEQFKFLRSLKPIKEVSRAVQTLELDSVLDHSLLHLGLMHQMLDRTICFSGVHDALELFNNIQEETDRNKSKSIMEFLQVPLDKVSESSSVGQTHPYRLEYADSHGQLPYHQLASFLDLATEARMLGLGEWLLYSDDLDEALLPSSTYTHTCLAPSLIRYASVNHDDSLLALVTGKFDNMKHSTSVRASVRTHRAFFDAEIERANLTQAVHHLRALKGRSARIGLSNYAHLAALILRLESHDAPSLNRNLTSKKALLSQATKLLERMLSRYFAASESDRNLIQTMQYRQQISHILRVFAQCDNSTLKDLAKKYAAQYASGNNIFLPIREFNVLLDGIVQAYGPQKGREVYDLFCEIPASNVLEFGQAEENERYEDEATVPTSQAVDRLPSTEEFPNPFFPTSMTQSDVSSSEVSNSDRVVPTVHTARFLRPLPITIARPSTLRIIVRGALGKKSTDEITDWAVAQFALIGTKSANIIAQEIQRPLTDIDVAKQRNLLYQLSEDNRSRYHEREQIMFREKNREEEEQSLWAAQLPSTWTE